MIEPGKQPTIVQIKSRIGAAAYERLKRMIQFIDQKYLGI